MDQSGQPHGDADRAAVATRPAEADDLVGVMRVLDGALLEVGADAVRARIASGAVVVAAVDGLVVGGLVRDGHRIEAVAVVRSRRGQGIGTALVEAAAEQAGTLTAAFDPRVRGFYETLGFDVAARDGRLWGRRDGGRETGRRDDQAEAKPRSEE